MFRLFLEIFVLLFGGYVIGERTAPHAPRPAKGALGLLLAFAISSAVQTAFYYLNLPLGKGTDLWSVAVVAVVAALIHKFIPSQDKKPTPHDTRSFFERGRGPLLFLIALVPFYKIIRRVAAAGTTESILTPWPLLPDGTVFWIAALFILLALSTFFVKSRFFAALHSGLAIFTVTSITPLVYKIGFGFDGFLHTASQRILLETGTLSPKPFYYIGQYVFTTWISRNLGFALENIDRWLVPLLAAILLPLILYFITQPTRTKKESHSIFAFLLLPLLPLASFIATTPQHFSYLLSVSALLLAAAMHKDNVHPVAPLLLSLWALLVHPLAGLPIVFVVLALLIVQKSRVAAGILAVFAAISVPAAFWALSLKNGIAIAWSSGMLMDFGAWGTELSKLSPFVGHRFTLWPAWAELTRRATFPLFALLAAAGAARTKNKRAIVLSASGALLWFSGAVLNVTSDFRFLIEYERTNYADRLQTLAFFCFVAAALPAVTLIAKRIKKTPALYRGGAIVVLFLWCAGLAYTELPRNDALVTGRGWSTSAYDLSAVRLIHRDANGADYTVLANQSVSAGAVSEIGFLRYADDVFFYPIPTGGELYDIFLRMTYESPTRDTAFDAAELGTSDLVYVVVNDYWWQSKQLTESLRDVADASWDIPFVENEADANAWKVRIYKFDFNTDSNSENTTSGE